MVVVRTPGEKILFFETAKFPINNIKNTNNITTIIIYNFYSQIPFKVLLAKMKNIIIKKGSISINLRN